MVTEANPSPIGCVWERLHYDWCEPGRIKGRLLAPAFPLGVARKTVAAHLRHFLDQVESTAG